MKRILVTVIGTFLCTAAYAQSPDYMREDCSVWAQAFFQDYQAKVETSYEGQRTDGTHAVNGSIFLETRSEAIQCSYNEAGDTLVDFVAEGKSWPAFARGEGSPHKSGVEISEEPPASDDASTSDGPADVKFKPGTSGVTLEGAIRGKDYFDYRLSANSGQTMSVDLRVDGTNGDGIIYFNILQEGGDTAMYVGSMDGNSAQVKLPASGPYIIRLYLMGNDRDTDKTVGYDLDVSIR